ncbi:hypothetical protein [Silicimonas algicola]|uniref:Lipoprotein n=1 Tax=Silicimonas algicola TaxID=1826607 RepID=A0A316FZK1_9RHOB|nr:hypothetical protein [Silicimonas algicola]PWK54071.1 hypothetical protein C8D95_11259 [Silicimonas algicola]
MRKATLIGVILLASACENQSLGIGATFDSHGARVRPSVSGTVGDVGIAVAPR